MDLNKINTANEYLNNIKNATCALNNLIEHKTDFSIGYETPYRPFQHSHFFKFFLEQDVLFSSRVRPLLFHFIKNELEEYIQDQNKLLDNL